MLAIIDYGVGNLFSLTASLRYLDIEAEVTANPEKINNADRIILPGVGAFSDAKDRLVGAGLDKVIKKEIETGKPLLGICLGMQLLFDKSYEYGKHDGLGLIPGEVRAIEDDFKEEDLHDFKIPHIGWNSIDFDEDEPLFKYSKPGDYVYYVHSFQGKNCRENTIASSMYGVKITGAVRNKNVYGTQFHPEKSGAAGLNILKAFMEVK